MLGAKAFQTGVNHMRDKDSSSELPSSEDLKSENRNLRALLAETRVKLEQRVKDLDDLEEAGQLVNSSFDLERILFHLIYFPLKMTDAEVGSIMLLEEGRLVTRISWSLEDKIIRSIKIKKSGLSICDEALLTQQLLMYSNPREHPDLECKEDEHTIESVLCIPLLTRNRAVGILNIVNSKRIDEIDEFAKRIIKAVAGFAAVAIDNALLHNESLVKQKYEQELQLGRDIQLGLLPQKPPQIPGLDIATKYSATKEVGGDYFDLLTDSGLLHVIVADVSSKGVPAALVMTATRAILRGTISHESSPKNIIARSNQLVCSDINRDTEMFVTLFYACLDLKKRKLHYTNAGHCYPLIFRKDLREPMRLKAGGLFLGILDDAEYEEETVDLLDGDLLFFYTDGVVESLSPQGDLFGESRVCEYIRKHLEESSKNLIDGLFKELVAFSGDLEQYDDIAMVAIRLIA